MYKNTFEESIINKTRILNLRIQVSTLCLYNLLITFIALSQERLVWTAEYNGSQYADKLGLGIAVPLLTPKFGTLFCLLNIIFNCCMLFPIAYPHKTLKYYLLPGILWNVYTLTAHLSNIFEMIYDLIILSTKTSISINLIITSIFLMALHLMLVLSSLSYYDFCTLILTDTKNITISEIDDYFSGNENNLLTKDFHKEYETFYKLFCEEGV